MDRLTWRIQNGESNMESLTWSLFRSLLSQWCCMSQIFPAGNKNWVRGEVRAERVQHSSLPHCFPCYFICKYRVTSLDKHKVLDVTLVTLSHCYTTYNENYLLRKHEDKSNNNKCQYWNEFISLAECLATKSHQMWAESGDNKLLDIKIWLAGDVMRR